jgi:hypothetical protein
MHQNRQEARRQLSCFFACICKIHRLTDDLIDPDLGRLIAYVSYPSTKRFPGVFVSLNGPDGPQTCFLSKW